MVTVKPEVKVALLEPPYEETVIPEGSEARLLRSSSSTQSSAIETAARTTMARMIALIYF